MLLFTGACGGDFHMSTSNVDVTPVSASPGDVLVVRFLLSLLPPQSHTMVVFIDDTEHMRLTVDGAPDIPVVIELGAAVDLLSRYGAGVHSLYIQVRANDEDETTRTATVGFELDQGTP
jgi:hypothetical protein